MKYFYQVPFFINKGRIWIIMKKDGIAETLTENGKKAIYHLGL